MAAPQGQTTGDFKRVLKSMNQRLDSIERHKHNGMLPLTEGSKDIPNPPTFVNWDREIISGEPGVRTTWLEPTQNTDGTELKDFYRYEVQQQVGLTVSWDAPTMVAPAKGDESLNRLMDRAGMGEGWTGGDGGASHRDTAGRDWWFWSDSNWGELREDGSTRTWLMLRNSLTYSVGADRDSMVMKTGRINLLPSVLTSANWVLPSSSGSMEDVPGGIRFTTTVDYGYVYSPVVDAAPGEGLTFSFQTDADPRVVTLRWLDDDGAIKNTRGDTTPGQVIYSVSDIAPEGATRAQLLITAWPNTPTTVTHAYAARGGSRMASWRSDIKEYQFTNLMHDPEGRGKGVDTTVTEVFRNTARNPRAEVDDTTWTNKYNGATVVEAASSSAWVGTRVHRVNRNQAGNALLLLADRHASNPLTPGTQIRWRYRLRKGSLTNPTSTITLNPTAYLSGSGKGSGGPSKVVPLTDEWTEVELEGVVPDGSDNVGIQFLASGPAWSAADWFEIDGRERYVAPRLPERYFDGSTPSGDGLIYEWSGTPHASDAVMSATSRQRRNVAIDSDTPDLADWAPTNAAFTVSLDASDHPTGGTGTPMPQIVNSAALDPVRTKIASNPGAVTGIGINSDSTGETTGNQSNSNLSDRYVETLQRELRRVQKSPGVLVDPVGYYGGSSYVAARFQHPGPVDWVTRGPFVEFTDAGVGGRGFALPYGSSTHLRATFSRATLELATHSWGRTAVVFVDGEEKARLDTFASSPGLLQWDTGELGYGEHMISVESSRAPNLSGGEVRVAGAMLFDDASDTAGVRVYDMSCSGRALEDHVNNPVLLEHGLERPMDLMVWSLEFNDAGRNITPAQHKANYKTVIARHRSLGFSGPILIMAKWTPSATVTDQWTYTMDQYRTVMREVAQEDPTVAFVDLGEVMPGPDVDESLYQDWVHQNEIGNERIAGVLRELLAPTPAPSSVLVETTGLWGGVDFTGYPTGVFAKDGTWTFSVDVKGPVGSRFRVQVDDADGAGGVLQSPIIDFTGDWQRESVTGVVTGDAPIFTVRKAVQAAVDFRVARPLIEEGAVTRDYFSSSTPDTDLIDYRALPDGTAIASAYTPPLWTGWGGSRVSYDAEVGHGFGGSIHVQPSTTSNVPGVYVEPGHTVAGGVKTAVAFVRPGPTTTTMRLWAYWSGGSEYHNFTVRPGEWNELRHIFDTGTADFTRLLYLSADDEAFHLTEVTLVDGEYTAPAFSGGSGGSHAHSVWNGLPYQSTSTLTMSNTSHTEDEYQHTTLITADAVGLEGWKFLWCQGAIGVGDTGLMFLQSFFHRPMGHETGFNFHRYGDIVVARFDLATETLRDVYVLEEKADTQWGEGLWIDGDWLYVYGGAEHEDEVRVERFPVAEMTTRLESREVWDGTAWSSTATDAAPVANLPLTGGFSAVRVLNGKWVALFTAGFMDHLQSWEATAPEGPFVPVDVVWSYPDDGVNRYVPRFHPQFDSGQYGVSMSVCESGQDKYRPFFLRGPSGNRQAAFGDAFWGESRFVEDPEHVAVPVGLDEPYAVRVRTADKYGNVSVWAEGQQQGPGASLPEVPKPSTPTALSFFRGGRVYYDGLDEWGERYEGFRHYEVHLSSAQDFDPNNWTRADASIAEGGWTPISVDQYGVYYVVIVVVTDHGMSVASEPATFSPERLSNPDLGDMLIDGARLQPGTVNASSLTVGAFSDNLLLNSGFEVAALEDGTKPSMWTAGWPRGDHEGMAWEDTGHWERVEGDPISGKASLRIDTYETTWRQVLSDPPIPVKPGDIYYVGARFRTDGIDGDVRLNLLVGATEADVNNFGVPEQQTLEVGRTAGGQSVNLVEGPVEIPAEFGDGSGVDMLFAAVAIEARATGRSYTTWVDDVEVKRIVGEAAIADASINRAKIRYLAVDDARIANVGVGKLVAGELFADITISSRIMTAETGKRWEANIDGAFTFNPTLTAGNDQVPITQMTSTDGGLVSRWFRTNTAGTRIEMGTYGMGANSALMSFYENATDWQFPPAFGFGGGARQGSTPGLAMHAGSLNETYYDRYGMNMIAVDQQEGIHLYTGNLLQKRSDGTIEGTIGAPIRINAGGPKGTVEILGGGYDGARLFLTPDARGFGSPPYSELAMNYGTINLLRSGTVAPNDYHIRFAYETEWGAWPKTHMLLTGNTFRFSSANESNALTIDQNGDIKPAGALRGRGWNEAAWLKTQGTDTYYATIYYSGGANGTIGIRIHEQDGTQVASGTL